MAGSREISFSSGKKEGMLGQMSSTLGMEEHGGETQLVPLGQGGLPLHIPRVDLAALHGSQDDTRMLQTRCRSSMGSRASLGGGSGLGDGGGGGGARGLRLSLHGCCLPQPQPLCR